ncbi:MAG: hypothetical protein WCD47_20975 [Candidatus Sulfotelmatobacter sp.]
MDDNQSARNQEADHENIEEAIRILFEPGQVVEVRAPKAGKYGTVSGYVNDHKKLAEKLEQLSGKVGAVYYTLNPVNPALLARASNRARKYAKDTTSDAQDNIVERNWLLVDCDPVRPADISSTDEEKTAAKRLVPKIKKYLKTLGWADPVIADSGNGYHLLYRIDLPNDDNGRKLLESALKALAAQFDTSAVKIDQKVFNASRITKAYGTKACKGDSIPERSHRLSKMFAPPESLGIVTRDLLLVLASEAPEPEKSKSPQRSSAPTPGGWTPELVEATLVERAGNHLHNLLLPVIAPNPLYPHHPIAANPLPRNRRVFGSGTGIRYWKLYFCVVPLTFTVSEPRKGPWLLPSVGMRKEP